MDDIVYHPSSLNFAEQRLIIDTLRNVQPGFYDPVLKSGAKMSIKMNCLGWHWSAKDYRYHKTRVDGDNLPCAAIPYYLQLVAKRLLLESKYLTEAEYRPFDVCIVNWYAEGKSKLGSHQDNSESRAAIESGYPIVSLSLGADAVFEINKEKMTLKTGDCVIFGRSQRLAYHGIKKVFPNTTPVELGLNIPARINLTFRIL